MTLNRLVSRAKARNRARANVRAMGRPRITRLAAVKGSSLVQSGGVVLDGQGVAATNGDLVRVQNAGRPSKAVFVSEDKGAGVIISRGGSSSGGGGTGMIAHDLNGSWHTGTLPWSKLTANAFGQVAGASIATLDRAIGGASHFLLDDLTDPAAHTQYALKDHVFSSGVALEINGLPDAIDPGGNGWNLAGGGRQGPLTFSVLVAGAGGLGVDGANGLILLEPLSSSARTANAASVGGGGHTHTIQGENFSTTIRATPRTVDELMKTNLTGGFVFGSDENFMEIDPTNRGVAIGHRPVTDSDPLLRLSAMRNDQVSLKVQRSTGQTANLMEFRDVGDQGLVKVMSDGEVRSDGQYGYISGLRGWALTPWGDAEFNDVTVRGSLYASVFVADEKHAIGGELVVATAAKLVHELNIGGVDAGFLVNFRGLRSDPGGTMPIDAAWWFTNRNRLDVQTNMGARSDDAAGIHIWVSVEDPASGHLRIFGENDLLAVQTLSDSGPQIVNAVWFRVTNNATAGTYYRDDTDYFSYYCEVVKGRMGIIPAGAAVVRYGQPGTGLISLKSDREWDLQEADPGTGEIVTSNRHTPYLDVFQTTAEPWRGLDGIMRLGKLSGVNLPTNQLQDKWTEYGLGVANEHFSGNPTEQVFVGSNQRLYMQNIDLVMNRGSATTVKLESATGRMRLGSNVNNVASTFLDVNPASSTPYAMIGNYSGGQGLRYSSNSLNLKGTFYVQRPGYTGWHNIRESLDALEHQVVRVDGTATSNANKTVTISRLTLTMAAGVTQTVNPGTFTPLASGESFLVMDYTSNGAARPAYVKSGTSGLKSNAVVFAAMRQGAIAPSIRFLPGHTVISGDSIVSGTITARQVKAGSITANEIDARNLKIDYGNINNPPATDVRGISPFSSTARYKKGAHIIRTESNRVTNVYEAIRDNGPGSFTSSNWTNLGYYNETRLVFVNGNITLGAGVNVTGVRLQVARREANYQINVANTTLTGTGTKYLYVLDDPSRTQPVRISTTMTQPSTANRVYFASVIYNNGKPEVNIFGRGYTYISGDRIVTGSIAANRIDVDYLESLATRTGHLIFDRDLATGTFAGIETAGRSFGSMKAGVHFGVSKFSVPMPTGPRLIERAEFEVNDGNNSYIKFDSRATNPLEIRTRQGSFLLHDTDLILYKNLAPRAMMKTVLEGVAGRPSIEMSMMYGNYSYGEVDDTGKWVLKTVRDRKQTTWNGDHRATSGGQKIVNFDVVGGNEVSARTVEAKEVKTDTLHFYTNMNIKVGGVPGLGDSNPVDIFGGEIYRIALNPNWEEWPNQAEIDSVNRAGGNARPYGDALGYYNDRYGNPQKMGAYFCRVGRIVTAWGWVVPRVPTSPRYLTDDNPALSQWTGHPIIATHLPTAATTTMAPTQVFVDEYNIRNAPVTLGWYVSVQQGTGNLRVHAGLPRGTSITLDALPYPVLFQLTYVTAGWPQRGPYTRGGPQEV